MQAFLNNSKNIYRDSYLWNMIGSMLLAFQSVILLMVLTRVLGVDDAGIFTLAYANANLFFTMGKYGMRYFQASDVIEQFSFKDYICSRIITSACMIVGSFGFTVYLAIKNSYTIEKMLIVFFVCIFKLPDVIEDVYYGRYQQKARLDIAAKTMTLRVALTTLCFILVVILSKNLLFSVIVSTVFAFLLVAYFIKITIKPFADGKKWEKAKVFELLRVCFPLFVGAFLSIYITNAPKYSIDALLNDELQACYGFISMPVMVISLLNGIIFNPLIQKMSIIWKKRETKAFLIRVIVQAGVVLGITLCCIIAAFFLGIPVLSFLFNVDLTLYKRELIILLIGGGLLGLSGLLNTVITIIRFQDSILIGYGIVTCMAIIFSDYIVSQYKLMGAAILYMLLMASLCILFLIFLIIGIIKDR